jgi:hypothetical protein
MFDVHLYVYGPTSQQAAQSSKETMFKAFAASNFYLRDYIDKLKKVIDTRIPRSNLS